MKKFLTRAITAAFGAVGDLTHTAVFRAINGSVYNASAGVASTLVTSTVITLLVLRDTVIPNPTNPALTLRQRRALLDAAALAVTPKLGDTLFEDGLTWRVTSVESDTGKTYYSLMLDLCP